MKITPVIKTRVAVVLFVFSQWVILWKRSKVATLLWPVVQWPSFKFASVGNTTRDTIEINAFRETIERNTTRETTERNTIERNIIRQTTERNTTRETIERNTIERNTTRETIERTH